MAVNYYQFFKSTTSIPSATATSEFTDGFYVQQGTLEYLIVQIDVSMTGTIARGTDLSDLISRMRIVIDGTPWHDWVSGSVPVLANAYMGRYGHFINSIGGRSFTVPGANDASSVQGFIAIPMGANLTSSTPRFEVTIGYNNASLTLGGAPPTISSASITYLGKYNSATEKSTQVISATSHAFAGSNLAEQVVARVPSLQQSGWKVMGAYIQNDSEADEYSTNNAIRNLSISQFGLPVDFQRWASGEIANGSAYTRPATSTIAQTYTAQRLGCLFMPLYNLDAGDLTFVISSSAATTRFITPVLVRPLSGVDKLENRQTARSPGNVSRTVIARTEGDA